MYRGQHNRTVYAAGAVAPLACVRLGHSATRANEVGEHSHFDIAAKAASSLRHILPALRGSVCLGQSPTAPSHFDITAQAVSIQPAGTLCAMRKVDMGLK
jgi:hypothetical protein